MLRFLAACAAVSFLSSSAQTPETNTRAVIDRFNEAFNRHDADALAAVLTDDTVFEDTSPAPDGRRIEGKPAVVEFWRGWFARNADAKFDAEQIIVSGDRAVILWIYWKRRTLMKPYVTPHTSPRTRRLGWAGEVPGRYATVAGVGAVAASGGP